MSEFDVKRLKPVTVITGHYGVGKTNLAINLALDACYSGLEVQVADLDVVNPYFRSSDYRGLLEHAGVQVIAPRYAGTTLDVPAISGQVSAALDWARAAQGRLLLIDAGGDDVGATALGRFARGVVEGAYDLLYVVNRSRNLTHDPAEALSVLREIEAASHLRATAVVNNTHLAGLTDGEVLGRGVAFAQEVAASAGLPLAFTAVPASALEDVDVPGVRYLVSVHVRKPWE